jgi:hypothetical protein
MSCAPGCLDADTAANANDEFLASIRFLRSNRKLSGDALLCVCICREVLLRNKSRFAPFINFLLQSEKPATIADWSDAQLAELEDLALTKRCANREENLEIMYERIRDMLLSERDTKNRNGENETLFDNNSNDENDQEKTEEESESGNGNSSGQAEIIGMTKELFMWSWRVIQARAFGRRLPWSALVPLADCFNHANVAIKYKLGLAHVSSTSKNNDGNSNNAVSRSREVGIAATTTAAAAADDDALDYSIASSHPSSKPLMFTLYTSRDNCYAVGDEVYNSYGRRSNDHLLLDYGFCLLDNEWERVSLRVAIERQSSNTNDSSTSSSSREEGEEVDAELATLEERAEERNRIFLLRKALLRMYNLTTTKTLRISKDCLCEEALIFFRVANLNRDQLEKELERARNEKEQRLILLRERPLEGEEREGGEEFDLEWMYYNEENERIACDALRSLLASVESEWKDCNSEEEDAELLLRLVATTANTTTEKGRSLVVADELECAIKYRITRKRIIAAQKQALLQHEGTKRTSVIIGK